MKKDIELYELIEKYVTEALTGEEKLAFESQISGNPEIARALENQRQLAELIEEGTLLEIRNSIQKIHEEHPGGGTGGAKGGKILLFSSIILITSLILYTLFFNESREQKSTSPAETVPVADSMVRIQESEMIKEKPEITSPESGRFVDGNKPDEKISHSSTGSEPSKPVQPVADRKTEKSAPRVESDSIRKTASSKPDTSIMANENPGKHPVKPIHKDSINCDTVIMHADVQIEESCEERATGKMVVKVESEKGALPPYSVSIDNGRTYQHTLFIDKLMPGNYIVWLKDKNNCLTKAGSYLIGSLVCDYEFIFAPDKGERWEIPSQNRNGTVNIYSKQGTLVFTQRFEEGEIISWDGNSLNGDPQSMGIYRFILELVGEEPVVGSVTIVR